jgi:hypothetical protein
MELVMEKAECNILPANTPVLLQSNGLFTKRNAPYKRGTHVVVIR